MTTIQDALDAGQPTFRLPKLTIIRIIKTWKWDGKSMPLPRTFLPDTILRVDEETAKKLIKDGFAEPEKG